VSVLIGLCDFRDLFPVLPSAIGLVERCGEGDIGDAIALDRRKDRIDGAETILTAGSACARTLDRAPTVASFI
jgi:hypothetical protein